jgi:uncharacterized membrane protein YbhN (UPF0104 family)
MKPGFPQALRVIISAVLLVLAWHLVDGEQLLEVLRTMDMALLCAAIVITVPMHLLSALRWRLTCAQIGAPISLPGYYLASWLNTVLPGGISGDALRVWRQSTPSPSLHGHPDRPPGGFAERFQLPLHGVVLERLAGQCALFAVLGTGVAINHARLMPLLHELLMLGGLIALGIAVSWALISFAGRRNESRPGWHTQLIELRRNAKRAFSPWPTVR